MDLEDFRSNDYVYSIGLFAAGFSAAFGVVKYSSGESFVGGVSMAVTLLILIFGRWMYS